MTKKLINIYNLSKEYLLNQNTTSILNNIDFNLFEQNIVSITGPSGSGKSTFLNILGLLDSKFSGNYQFLNHNVKLLKNSEKNNIRNKSIGFVHQFFYLIPELNVLENVLLPNLIKNNNYKISLGQAEELITSFGLKKKLYSKPNLLSGGEQQRVAIARALVNKPDIIIADEMTGNLDEKTANSIFEFFLETIKFNKQSVIFVTHNKKYANRANDLYEISNQKLIKIL